MDKLQENNKSILEWHCHHCGALNKLATAKFCGQCGSARIIESAQPVIKAETNIDSSKSNENISPKTAEEEATNKTNVADKNKEELVVDNNNSNENNDKKDNKIGSFLNKIKNLFKPNQDKQFNVVISTAILLLFTSLIASYKMYTNVNTIRLPKTRFTDISIDHPIYSVCKNLLDIDAISFRKKLELAPYEKISATEWNHVLKQASKHLNQEYSIDAYFTVNDLVSVENLNNKLKALNEDSSEIIDTSRIQSFYMLEQTLFN